MAKLIIKRTSYVLAIVLVIIFSTITYLCFTTSGAKFIVNRVNGLADNVLNIDADINDGSLAYGLTIKNFRLEVFDIVTVSSDYIKLNYSIFDVLIKNALLVDKLETNNLRVQLLSSNSKTQPSPQESQNTKINFPINIQIKALQASNFAYNSDIVDVYVNRFNARLSAYKNAAFIHEGDTLGVYVHLKEQESKTTTITPTKPKDIESQQVKTEDLRLSLEPLFNVVLPLNVGILNFNAQKVRYQMQAFDSDVSNLMLSALFNGDKLNVLKLIADNDVLALDLKGDMIFKDFYKLNFMLNVTGKNTYKAQNTYDGFFYDQKLKLTAEGDLLDLKLNLDSTTDNKLNAAVHIRPLDPNFYIKANINADNFAYPLHSKQKNFSLSKLAADIEGQLSHSIDFKILTKFTGYGFDNFAIDANGLCSFESLNLNKLNIKGKYQNSNVALNSKAKLNFKDQISLDDDIELSLSDANFINPILKGALKLNTKLNMQLTQTDYIVKIPNLTADFNLNNHKATATIDELYLDSKEHIQLKLLELKQRKNLIVIKGDSLTNTGLNASIHINNLKNIYANLRGPLLASIKFMGNFSDYALDVKANSTNIEAFGTKINDIVFNANYNSENISFNLTSFANTVIFNEKLLPSKRCIIELTGSLSDHKFQSGCGGVNSFFISFKGGFDLNKLLYQGNIIEFFIENQKNGNLSMQQHTNLVYDAKAQSFHLDPILLDGKLAKANVEKLDYVQGALQTKLSVFNLNIKHFEDLDKNLAALNMYGSVDLKLDVDTNPLKRQIKANIQGHDIAFRSLILPIAFDNLAVDLNLNNDNLALNTQILLKRKQGALNSKLYIDNLSTQKRLRGNLKLNDFNLSVLSFLLKDSLNSIEGSLNLDADLGGSLTNPLIYGSIVTKGSLEPRYGIGSVEHFDLNIEPKGNKAAVFGVVSLNKSDINILGDLNWERGANGIINIKTNNTPVFLAGYGRAFTSFDTNINLLDDYLDINGDVNIDSASIKVRSIADSYVSTSSDEVLVSNAGLLALDNTPKNSAFNSKINLNIALGDAIDLDAMGLKAKVRGSLLVLKELDDRVVNGKGRIYLEDGVANLYGHNFIVNRANTNFNGDITNPILDAEVVVDKNDLDDDVIVGVQLNGLATKPNIKFFSNPPMSQNEILSYILYGYGLDNRATAQDANNTNLLLNLGLGSTTSLVNSFVQAIGINGVQFNTQGSGDDTQLALESNISRKIKISYGYGIFSAVGEFKLRYELVRSLYVEFISSVNQAVDIVYSFDFD